jgi:hypothetical protein
MNEACAPYDPNATKTDGDDGSNSTSTDEKTE